MASIKQYLPASSRSFHSMYRELGEAHDEIRGLSKELERTNARLDALQRQQDDACRRVVDDVSARVMPAIEQTRTRLATHDAHMKMLAWAAYRRDGETEEEAKRRFFASMPKAKGGLRLLQLGCTRLLSEFDRLCQANDIDYWMDFGTLLGAVRHKGFVPWDDDTDLGMMREDVERLRKAVEHDGRFRMTLVYDHIVHCRQIRFWFADEDVPCFLDLFVYDWTPTLDPKKAQEQRRLRTDMVRAMDADERLAFWKEQQLYPADSGERTRLLQGSFDDCLAKAREIGAVCDKDDAKGVVWSVDNMDDGVQRQWSYALEDVFPLRRMRFEDVELSAPANADKLLWSQYGDYYELPDDILTHFQHVDRKNLESSQLEKRMKETLQGKGV